LVFLGFDLHAHARWLHLININAYYYPKRKEKGEKEKETFKPPCVIKLVREMSAVRWFA
jgi:hypothetical protein